MTGDAARAVRVVLAASAVAIMLALGVASSASAGEVMDPADAAELAQTLADAQEQQGVCYGWEVTVNGAIAELGSSDRGPGNATGNVDCPRGHVVLSAALTWTCDTCESSDSWDAGVQSSLQPGPTLDEIRELGIDPDGLNGESGDETLIAMVGALPLLVAQHGLAPPVAFETPAAVPATDRLTGSPAPDALRQLGPGIAVGLLLLLIGPGWAVYKNRQDGNRPTFRLPGRPT